MTLHALPPKVSVATIKALREASAALLAMTAKMPAAAAALNAFVQTMRVHLPADTATSAAVPDAIGEDGIQEYDVQLWHDLLWYGYVRSAGVTASGFGPDQVLADLRGQIARLCELPGPDRVMLRPVPVPGT